MNNPVNNLRCLHSQPQSHFQRYQFFASLNKREPICSLEAQKSLLLETVHTQFVEYFRLTGLRIVMNHIAKPASSLHHLPVCWWTSGVSFEWNRAQTKLYSIESCSPAMRLHLDIEQFYDDDVVPSLCFQRSTEPFGRSYLRLFKEQRLEQLFPQKKCERQGLPESVCIGICILIAADNLHGGQKLNQDAQIATFFFLFFGINSNFSHKWWTFSVVREYLLQPL